MFQPINCITPTPNFHVASMHIHICSLRYINPIGLDQPLITEKIWPNLSKVAPMTPDTDCVYAVMQHVFL